MAQKKRKKEQIIKILISKFFDIVIYITLVSDEFSLHCLFTRYCVIVKVIKDHQKIVSNIKGINKVKRILV